MVAFYFVKRFSVVGHVGPNVLGLDGAAGVHALIGQALVCLTRSALFRDAVLHVAVARKVTNARPWRTWRGEMVWNWRAT